MGRYAASPAALELLPPDAAAVLKDLAPGGVISERGAQAFVHEFASDGGLALHGAFLGLLGMMYLDGCGVPADP